MMLNGRRQRRVLTEMHRTLHGSDPRLVAGFTAFSRITQNEAMPAIERLRVASARWLMYLVRQVLRGWRLAWRRAGRPRAALFLPALVVVLLAVLLVVTAGRGRACLPTTAMPTAASAQATFAASAGTGCPGAPPRTPLSGH